MSDLPPQTVNPHHTERARRRHRFWARVAVLILCAAAVALALDWLTPPPVPSPSGPAAVAVILPPSSPPAGGDVGHPTGTRACPWNAGRAGAANRGAAEQSARASNDDAAAAARDAAAFRRAPGLAALCHGRAGRYPRPAARRDRDRRSGSRSAADRAGDCLAGRGDAVLPCLFGQSAAPEPKPRIAPATR